MRRHLTKFPPYFFSYWLKMFFILGSFATFFFLFYDQIFGDYAYWVIDFNDNHTLVGNITDAGDAGNYLVLLCAMWIWFVVLLPKIPPLQGWRAKTVGVKNLVLQALSSIVIAGLITEIFKIIIGRQRPHCAKYFDPYSFKPFAFDPHFHSFPSGHSEFIFCLMTILSFKWRRFRELFFFVAVMISLSRVFLGQHFFSDVVMGAFMGCFVASVCHYLLRDLWPLHPLGKHSHQELDWAR